jgi:SAM-dependent methyltransferase
MSDGLVRTVTRCQSCDSAHLDLIMDFPHQPPVHALLHLEELDLPEQTYPVRFIRCLSCGLVQLGHVVDPRVVFPEDYPYRTSLTPVMRRNFAALADEARQRFGLKDGDLVVDIGSNDGTLLSTFQERGLRVLGVEPTGVARIAEERGIPTLNAFFDRDVARRIRAEHGPARVVTATNVIAHIDGVNSIVASIRELLSPDGIFVSESHYLLDLLERVQYDVVYHEHLRYYSLHPFVTLLARNGLTMVDAQRVGTHAGSIRVWASVATGAPPSRRLEELLAAEDALGLHDEPVYLRFRERVLRQKHGLLSLLLRLRGEGARVAGVGSPARSGMVLNTCHIDADLLMYIREQDASPKVGRYMPGSHVPIVGEARFYADQPEYALLLSWHLADELMPDLRARGYRGRFIMPFPEPTVVDAP